MLVPLYGFVEGDTLGLVVLAHDTMTMSEVAEKLRRSAGVRVRIEGELRVRYRGKTVDPDATVASAGFEALDRIDVTRAEQT
jgi:hypothetical protein